MKKTLTITLVAAAVIAAALFFPWNLDVRNPVPEYGFHRPARLRAFGPHLLSGPSATAINACRKMQVQWPAGDSRFLQQPQINLMEFNAGIFASTVVKRMKRRFIELG